MSFVSVPLLLHCCSCYSHSRGIMIMNEDGWIDILLSNPGTAVLPTIICMYCKTGDYRRL